MLVSNIRKNPFVLAPTLTAILLILMGALGFIPLRALGQTASHLVSGVTVMIIFLIPSLFYFSLRGNILGRFGFAAVTRDGWQVAFSAAALLILQNLLYQALFFADRYDYRIYTLYGSELSAETGSFGSVLLIFFVFVVIPVLAEGIFFRGIVLYEYRYTGPVLSILFSSVLCGLTTMSFPLFPIGFLNGLILALTVFLTGNIFFSLCSHALYLMFAVFAEKYFIFVARESETSVLFFFVFGLLFLLSVVWFFRCAETILRERGKAEDDLPRRIPERKKALVLYDAFSAPMLWGDLFCYLLFAVLHLFL